jgi:hypothetical protein
MPGYFKGRSPKNKGRKLPPEVLTHAEVERLLAVIPSHTKAGARHRAMIALMYRLGLKVGQIVAMERWHYEPGANVITVPGTHNNPDRSVPLDAITHEMLNHWWSIRSTLGLSPIAPLFPTFMAGEEGNKLRTEYVREALRRAARAAKIEKRVTPEGLRKTHEVAIAERASRLVAHMAAHIDEPTFGTRYPKAYERWRDAFDLFEVGGERNAARIGIDCRSAATRFTSELAARYDVELDEDASPLASATIKAVLRKAGKGSARVDAYVDALVRYWGAVVGLVNRQVHEAEASEPLTEEDARRALFQTMLVMHEIDSILQARKA